VEDVRFVEGFQAFDNLNENAPNVILTQVGLLFLMTSNLLEKITVVCILHYDTSQGNKAISTN